MKTEPLTIKRLPPHELKKVKGGSAGGGGGTEPVAARVAYVKNNEFIHYP